MRLNVAYASSEKYAKYAYISLLSLFVNNKDIEEIYVYYIEENLKETTKSMIIQLVNSYKRTIEFIPLNDLCSSISDMSTIGAHHGSMNIYSSLFLTKIKNVERILAIECDVIVNGSLKELIDFDLKDNYLAALYIPFPKHNKLYNEKYPWFINGGISIQDLDKLRKDNSEQRVSKFFEDATAIEGAETTLYSLYMDNIFPIPPEYHVTPDMYFFNHKEREYIYGQQGYYSQNDLEKAIKYPVLIHYASSLYGRPWDKKCDHPRKDIFLKYLDMSPWAGELEDGDINKRNKLTKFAFKYLPFSLFLLLRRLI